MVDPFNLLSHIYIAEKSNLYAWILLILCPSLNTRIIDISEMIQKTFLKISKDPSICVLFIKATMPFFPDLCESLNGINLRDPVIKINVILKVATSFFQVTKKHENI